MNNPQNKVINEREDIIKKAHIEAQNIQIIFVLMKDWLVFV